MLRTKSHIIFQTQKEDHDGFNCNEISSMKHGLKIEKGCPTKVDTIVRD